HTPPASTELVMGLHDPDLMDRGHLRGLVYRSRATMPLEPAALRALVEAAALRNRRDGITGTLLARAGRYVQWLEGPAAAIEALLERLRKDPRHADLQIVSDTSRKARAFPGCPMWLGNPRPEPCTGCAAGSGATASGEACARLIAGQDCRAINDHLVGRSSSFVGPVLDDLHPAKAPRPLLVEQVKALPLLQRAGLVDAVCAHLAEGWQADRWSSAEVALAMVRLAWLWRTAGRVPETGLADAVATLVVPPQHPELVTVMVKADLLRDAGASVAVVFANELATPPVPAPEGPILVCGPRILTDGAEAAALALARSLAAAYPGRDVHLGGAVAGPLGGCLFRLLPDPSRRRHLQADRTRFAKAVLDQALRNLAASSVRSTDRAASR
ncbi:MAG: BLUF domain-containing protein, partial [Gemmobacter sp.]